MKYGYCMDDLREHIVYIRGRVDHLADLLASRPCVGHDARLTDLEKRLDRSASMIKWFSGIILTIVATAAAVIGVFK